MSGPYLAAEDSSLLREALEEYSGDVALEIGAGNAGNLLALSKGFSYAVGTDLTRPMMVDWRQRGCDYVIADGASCVRDGCVDLVAFNPPYLPGEGDSRVEGGRRLEVPLKFLRDALRVVRPKGRVVMLLNDEADMGQFMTACSEAGFSLAPVAKRHLFFEELTVYEARSVSDAGGAQAGRQRR